jgi:hypothetical protein
MEASKVWMDVVTSWCFTMRLSLSSCNVRTWARNGSIRSFDREK